MTSFSDFGLNGPILNALVREAHTAPTPIQAAAIPIVMAGRDLLGIAQTGTGKTAAFSLPMLHRLAANGKRPQPRTCRALILSPTRELSTQIGERVEAYGADLGLTSTIAIGGVSIRSQIRALGQGVDILIGTPGRLFDLMQERALRLDAVEIFVLDEADRMLDMGFIHAIRKIAAALPAQRQSLFFSATMPREIETLARSLLRDPATAAVTPVAKTADRIEQRVAFVPQPAKLGALAGLLADPAVGRALVFTRTKRGADRVAKGLVQAGIEADAIHGNKSQPQRERALGAFRDGSLRVLVATDIAARGIDVTEITHVFNFELPNEPESYVHRIGRTGRAGAAGIAISLCNDEERAYLRAIEKLTKQSIPVIEVEGVAIAMPAPSRHEDPRARSRQGKPRQQQRQANAGKPRQQNAGAAGRAGNGGRPNPDRRGKPAAGNPAAAHAPAKRPAQQRPAQQRPAVQRHGGMSVAEVAAAAGSRSAGAGRRDARS
ncbi:MAG: DEAD/DEAH box helicase [Bauldia sp.]|nr:DEAD/DEAH box helicase [Bauldia sp.]